MRLVFLLFALLSVLAQAAQLPVTPLFAGRRDFALPDSALTLAVGDFNGDGRPDAAIGLQNLGIAVLLNLGHGQYGPAMVFGSNVSATSLAISDINGDGNADMIAPGTSAVNILYGNGDGTFQLPVSVPINQASPFVRIAVGDINGDGKPDLAVLSYAQTSQYRLSVLIGNGDGTFEPQQDTTITAENPLVLLLADFNADGNVDAVIVDDEEGIANVLLSKGDGTFQLSAIINTSNTLGSGTAATGDFNKDGKLDLALTTPFGLWILPGNGDGTFLSPLSTPCPELNVIAVGDLNGDGNADVFLSPNGAAGASENGFILLGDGDGTFQPRTTVTVAPQPGPVSGGAAIIDTDGDSEKDILLANLGEIGTLSLFLGNGDGSVEAGTTNSEFAASPIVAADFNGDGKLDLVGVPYPRGLMIALGNGNGTFGTASTFATSLQLNAAPLAADFNSDGKLDVAVSNNTSDASQIVILQGAGNGSFTLGATLDASEAPVKTFLTCDVNHDGKPDILVAGTAVYPASDSLISVFLNLGSGSFSSAFNTDWNEAGTNHVFCADLNGDGAADLISTTTVALGKGDGTFTQLPDPPFTDLFDTLSLVADLNRDGKPDLVLSGTNGVSIYLGNGDGTFTPGASYKPGDTFALGQIVSCNNVADFNLDGLPDIGCFDESSLDEIFLLGNGDGTFERASFAFGLPTRLVQVGDFNGDGKPDLIAAPLTGLSSTALTVLLNTTPSFRPTADSVTPSSGSGSPQLFSFAYSDSQGAADIGAAFVAFRSASGTGPYCLLVYANATQMLYLYNDAGTGLLPGIHLGSGTVQNSQCSINGAASSASTPGSHLAVNLMISFEPAFYGRKNIYLRAVSNEGLDSGYQIRGAWTGATDSAPAAVSVTPSSGSGLSQTFQFVFSDPNGAADIATSYLLINTSVSASNGCLILYSQPLNRLYLINDAGNNVVSGTITPGSTGSLSNSQCTIAGGGTPSKSGPQLTIPVNVTFSAKVTALQYIYSYATDYAGAPSPWKWLGYWTP